MASRQSDRLFKAEAIDVEDVQMGGKFTELSLPKPYYDHAGITIYHGDCREILPLLPKVDLVLTDPPYGINAARDRHSERNGWVDYEITGWDTERADTTTISLIAESFPRSVIWGGNYFSDVLPPRSKWLVWDKGQFYFSLADVELAWTSEKGAARRFFYPRSNALKDGKQHHTQKPVALMRWSIEKMPPSETVLDPFMGSGTTLRAAKDLGRKAIGIEICEAYCEIAAKRMAQEVFEF